MTVQLVELTVNGERHDLAIEPRRTLVDVLRHDLGRTGTNVGCEYGICGACTVLVDGAPAQACPVFAARLEGTDPHRRVPRGPRRHALRPATVLLRAPRAALRHCGFCTPGMLMLAEGYLAEEPATKEEIREVVA